MHPGIQGMGCTRCDFIQHPMNGQHMQEEIFYPPYHESDSREENARGDSGEQPAVRVQLGRVIAVTCRNIDFRHVRFDAHPTPFSRVPGGGGTISDDVNVAERAAGLGRRFLGFLLIFDAEMKPTGLLRKLF